MKIYHSPVPEIFGFMKKQELQWLFNMAFVMGSVVEVGCFKGRSTHALLSGCPGMVYAVDTFCGSPVSRERIYADDQNVFADFMKNVGHFKNLVAIKSTSAKAIARFKTKPVDMVFIDGCHTYESVMEDIALWRPVCRRLLCGHDIRSENVKRALSDSNIDYKIPTGSIWCYERRGIL